MNTEDDHQLQVVGADIDRATGGIEGAQPTDNTLERQQTGEVQP